MAHHGRGALSALWAFWRDYTAEVAHYQAVIWLGMVYFLVVGPTSLAMRLGRRSLLPSTFGRPGTHWEQRAPVPRALDQMRQLY